MAKGRKLTTNRSDRHLHSCTYGNGYVSQGSDVAEFSEEDDWSMVDDMADQIQSREDDVDSSPSGWSSSSACQSGGAGRRSITIPRGHQNGCRSGGLSLAFEDPTLTSAPGILHQFCRKDRPVQCPGRQSMGMSSSAPVNVPDWNKIYRVESVESMHEDSDEDRGSSAEKVPPHVYLARSRKMLATSVFEGQGRTLKGRDMSRVRDAVWNRTGFDG
ncbi:hypothetical protein SAY86_014388 [Trapa natans]|uniref:Senescence regulator n=1 Tax=Trapa natans TaxID=22666 RepID=A0AAN7KY95_TRANT|nr:hypothetical protein SAY86_014388 [Trapa natans]